MKIVIIEDKDGNDIGYDLLPETLEEKRTVGRVRDLIFFGFGDTHLKYDGIELVPNGVKRPEDLVKLKWIQEQHKK
tara:strand:- start:3387 stop:3614 length:228 start_codon:yes stop_codon:yes gene_type:complete